MNFIKYFINKKYMDNLTLIGAGSYSDVYLYKTVASTFVIKKIRSEEYINTGLREIEILKKIDHPNICKYKNSVTIDNTLFIHLEYGGVSLFDNKIPYDLFDVKILFKQIIDSVYYLHRNNIAHLDLSPRNILVNDDKIVKIIDFGSATYF